MLSITRYPLDPNSSAVRWFNVFFVNKVGCLESYHVRYRSNTDMSRGFVVEEVSEGYFICVSSDCSTLTFHENDVLSVLKSLITMELNSIPYVLTPVIINGVSKHQFQSLSSRRSSSNEEMVGKDIRVLFNDRLFAFNVASKGASNLAFKGVVRYDANTRQFNSYDLTDLENPKSMLFTVIDVANGMFDHDVIKIISFSALEGVSV
uniref:p23 protein n=1 Tax=Blueberry virus A TaxID=1206566 RepID=T1YWJ7_9CLOS|nr:p23 protein [Blueberry virus A]